MIGEDDIVPDIIGGEQVGEDNIVPDIIGEEQVEVINIANDQNRSVQNRIDGAIEIFRSEQTILLSELKNEQIKMQQRLEDSICKGLEGITTIRYGGQAMEYLEDTKKERQELKKDMMTFMTTAISSVNEKQDGKMDALESAQQRVTEVFAESMQSITTSVNDVLTTVQNNRTNITDVISTITDMKLDNNKNKHTKTTKQKPVKTGQPINESSDDSSEDEEEQIKFSDSSDDERTPSVRMSRTSVGSNGINKRGNLPPFTGKETWKVWFTRFKEVTKRQGLNDDERLDLLLPKLQGDAGDFVFDQLNSKIRNNYSLLKHELKNRFRKVENPKTYGAIFAARKQRSNESIEAYAADLKKLYDKAHAKRDAKTREEDLLRKFLDGISDTKASFHVEFAKDPSSIDEAVDEIINFQEVRKKQRGNTRRIEVLSDSSDDDLDPDIHIARAPGKPVRQTVAKDSKKENTSSMEATLKQIIQQLDALKKNTDNNKHLCNPYNQATNGYSASQATNGPYRDNSRSNFSGPVLCYHCNQPGHIKRNCPTSAFVSSTPAFRRTDPPPAPHGRQNWNNSTQSQQNRTNQTGNSRGPIQ